MYVQYWTEGIKCPLTYQTEREPMTQIDSKDRRVQRTINSLRNAFVELVLSRSYDDIKVADIIDKANVGRSTFYQHYASKDEMLGASLEVPMSILASACQPDTIPSDIQSILEHFWQNRSFARRILTGQPRRHIISTLSNIIEPQLQEQMPKGSQPKQIPSSMSALVIAEAQMVLIGAWLAGKGQCSAEVLAISIVNISQAMQAAVLNTTNRSF